MSNLRIAELDFDTIKTNLRTYLQSQSEFTDYDFEGSGLSTLLDVLAYNTHYNAYLANMNINEMFLDSAVKRSSAVSIAKHLGYTPTSARGSSAVLDVVVNSPTNLPSILTMDKFTPFTTTINSTAYTFYTTQDYTASRVGTTYTFNDISVKEGSIQSYTYAVTNTSTDARYEIPAANVDTTTLKVAVQTSATDTTTTLYTLATDITGLTSASKVYFIEEGINGKYYIYFGDGVLSKQLTQGNLVNITYLNVTGSTTNVSGKITQTFTASGTIGGSSNITATTVSNATGGSNKESITSIKFNAPKVNAAKNRAVTSTDYESLILSNFGDAEAISVWGGEDNDPPYYGKVLISLKPFEGFTINNATKDYIKRIILNNNKMVSVQPVFIDPEYIYVTLDLSVNYNSKTSSLTSTEIETTLRSQIQSYFTANLNDFNKTFYASGFTKYLMEQNSSIISIAPEISLQIKLEPTLGVSNTYTGTTAIKFYNSIHPNELSSTNFYITNNGVQTLVRLQDKSDTSPPDYLGTGTVNLINSQTGAIINSAGTINYGTGVVALTGITPTGYPTDQDSIQLTGALQELSYNISSSRNQILVLDDSSVSAIANRKDGLKITVTAIE